jgi:hypothetical protein
MSIKVSKSVGEADPNPRNCKVVFNGAPFYWAATEFIAKTLSLVKMFYSSLPPPTTVFSVHLAKALTKASQARVSLLLFEC